MNPVRRSYLAFAGALLLTWTATAQRYSGLSSPPTAPPASQPKETRLAASTGPIVPVSSGLGALQFYPVNYGVPAPQSLTRQLTSDDERTRQGALTALGAPSQYTARGSVPVPHSIQLEIAPLSSNDDLDALLTVELDHHVVTAILMPQGTEWRRIATVVFPTAFADPSTTPSTFLRTTRSLLEPTRYRAIFRARETQANGDYSENEAHLRILNGRAIVTSSFVSESKQCSAAPGAGKGAQECEFIRRWLQPDLSQPGVRQFAMVTSSGTFSSKDLAGPLGGSRDFLLSRLRSYTCQPFTYSDGAQHYEPTGPVGPCRKTPAHGG